MSAEQAPADAPAGRPLLMTLPELAESLRIDRATVYRLLQRKQLPIPVLRLGNSPRVRIVDVEAYLASLADEQSAERSVAALRWRSRAG